jgi:hypothetical protein
LAVTHYDGTDGRAFVVHSSQSITVDATTTSGRLAVEPLDPRGHVVW